MQRNEEGKFVARSLEDIARHINEFAVTARNRKHLSGKRGKMLIALDDAEMKAYVQAVDIILQTVLIKEEHQEDNVP